MKLKNIVIVVVLAAAGFAVYKMMRKKKKSKLIKDRGFEFEVEDDETEENDD